MNITQSQYEFALAKIEELLPLVPEDASADDKDAVELSILSDVVIEYEKEHFPIEKPTVAQLVELALEEKNMTQKQLAEEISDYVNGRAEPTLKIASSLCKVLDIQPSAMLGL